MQASDSILSGLDKSRQTEYWASLALRYCFGLGPVRLATLLHCFGSAAAAVQNHSSWAEAHIPAGVHASFLSEKWREPAMREWQAANRVSGEVILWTDPLYPERLREIRAAPAFMYCRGDTSLLANPCVAIVGSRAAGVRNLGVAEALASSLASCGITVVSGMAGGIDGFAHRGAISRLGRSIGVLGTGIDVRYPRSNAHLYSAMERQGLLLSEFPPGLGPRASHFPVRNRIISGLSLGVVVVEAALRSGSLITARLALSQNREVFAVPGSPLDDVSEGCKNLIRNGAHPVFSHEDILRELSGALKGCPEGAGQGTARNAHSISLALPDVAKGSCQAKMQGRAEENDPVLRSLITEGPLNTDTLADKLAMDVNELNSRLVILEIEGKVRRLPGSRFEVTY